MNSKQALERIKTAPDFMPGVSVYSNYSQSSTAYEEDITTVENDLNKLSLSLNKIEELLQIEIENHSTAASYDTLYTIKYSLLKKYKEWLNN